MNYSDLYRNQNYSAPIGYLFDKHIVEYDISKANISIMYDHGMIDQATYLRLLNAPRQQRQYEIGMMQKDKTVTERYFHYLEEARESLFQQLNLQDENILHIVKDAVFVVTKVIGGIPTPDIVQVGNYTRFEKRATYNSYVHIGPGVNIYYDYSPSGNKEFLRIRGIGEEAQLLHYEHFTRMLTTIMRTKLMVGSSAAYETCKKFYNALITNYDDPEITACKRRFDAMSKFDIKPVSYWSSFQADYLSDGAMERMVDPTYNCSILSMLGNIMLAEMMNGSR